MTVLALDLATQAGVAWGEPCMKPESASVDLGAGRSEGFKYGAAVGLALDLAATHKPQLVCIEAAIGGHTKSSFLIGLAACVTGSLIHAGFKNVIVVPPSTVRKHFLRGNITSLSFPGMTKLKAKAEIKSVVIRRCVSLGWRPQDDNAADALAAWDYACSTLSRSHQMTTIGGLFND